MTTTSPTPAALRDQIAAALYERERPPSEPAWAEAYAVDREVFQAMADAVLEVILPAARITASLARDSEAAVQRVIALYERWVKAGPPALGTSISRSWDQRLIELRDAVLPDEARARPPSGDDALRARITQALTTEWYRRAEEQIEASPEAHSAAMAEVVMRVLAGPTGTEA